MIGPNKNIARTILVSVLIFLFNYAQSLPALTYELQGKLICKKWSGSPNWSSEDNVVREFKFWSDEKSWQIYSESGWIPSGNPRFVVNNKEIKVPQEHKLIIAIGSGDDGYTYCVWYPTQNSNRCIAKIIPNNTNYDNPPYFENDSLVAYIWLGLGTVNYRGNSPDLPPPFGPFGKLHKDVDGGKFRARWEKFENPPHFPRRITYMNRGYLITPDAKGGDEQIPLGGIYTNGHVQTELIVTSYTNIGPYTFPLRYEVNRYHPGDASVPYGSLKINEQFIVKITSINTNAAPRDYRPPLTLWTQLNDYRFISNTNIGFISYPIYNKRWPTAEESLKIHLYRQKMKQAPKQRPELIALMFLLLGVPAFYFIGQSMLAKRKAINASTTTNGQVIETKDYGQSQLTTLEAIANIIPTQPEDTSSVQITEPAQISAQTSDEIAKPKEVSTVKFSILGWLIAHRITMIFLILVGVMLIPQWRYLLPPIGYFDSEKSTDTYLGRLERNLQHIDGGFYIEIARNGYKNEKVLGARAFYPLYPALIRVGSYLTGGNYVISGFLLSNLFSFLAALLFYDYVRRQYNNEIATWSVIFLFAMPGSMFLSLIYTESLFLILIILFFRYLSSGNIARAAMVGFFLPLSRPVGIFCILPLLWELYQQRRKLIDYLSVLVPLLGYAAYFGIIYYYTGDPFEGFKAQKYFPNEASIKKIIDVAGIGKALINITDFHQMKSSLLDRILFFGFLTSLPFIWRLNRTLFWYALPVGLFPALTNLFMSFTRYLVVVFPICILLAVSFRSPQNRGIKYALAALMFSIQLYLLYCYLTLGWA